MRYILTISLLMIAAVTFGQQQASKRIASRDLATPYNFLTDDTVKVVGIGIYGVDDNTIDYPYGVAEINFCYIGYGNKILRNRAYKCGGSCYTLWNDGDNNTAFQIIADSVLKRAIVQP